MLSAPTVSDELSWANTTQMDRIDRNPYSGLPSREVIQYAMAGDVMPVYQPGIAYQAIQQPQPTWEENYEYSIPAVPDYLEQAPSYSLYGAPQYQLPAAQPSDYITAMYDNGIQPMGFTAGPPGSHANGALLEAQESHETLGHLDFDMSHYEEALAEMTGFSGGVWS